MTFTVDSQLASRVVVIQIMLTHTTSNRAFVVVCSLWATSAMMLEVEWEINRQNQTTGETEAEKRPGTHMMVMKTAETRPDTATTALTVAETRKCQR